MEAITRHQPVDWREGRRLRAWDLKQQGWTQQAIAGALGVTPGAVSQWMSRARRGGVAALRRRPAPGPTPKLTAEQRAQLPALLARGAEAFGFRGEVWTARRVATVIRREFGVRYHPNHVGKLLRAAGWSPQKPRRRASQRDEAAIAAWHAERWPALKKGLTRRGGPSSGSTSPASTCCPAPSGPTPRAGRRRPCACR
jgi:transposase